MPTSTFRLAPLPPGPSGRAPEVRRAYRYLKATHTSVDGLIKAFNLVHEETSSGRVNAQGTLSHEEIDLLRAALVFTSSGLDAACHTLVSSCLPVLVDRTGSTAAKKFDIFMDELIREPTDEYRDAVKGPDPRRALVELYVAHKTKASYQGSGDLKDRVAGTLGIPNAEVKSKRFKDLDDFFTARNDIVHRLDYVTPGGPSEARHRRSPNEVVTECDSVIALVADLITAAATVLRP